MLNVDDVYPYLVDKGVLDAASVMVGDLEITSSTRRNRNLVVMSAQRSLLIKQPEAGQGTAESVRREIRFYRHFEDAPSLPNLGALLPRVAFVDGRRDLLGLEHLRSVTPLWRYYEECTAARFPIEASRALGAALARAHGDLGSPEALAIAEAAGLSSEAPSSLSLVLPRPARRATMSLGALELIRDIQAEDGVMARLDAMERAWQATSVIHGDVKLDNIVLDPHGASPRVYIVDWELVQFGDPAWDVGCVLRDFVFFWILSMPEQASVDDMVEKARFPLDVLQPAIAAFWSSYRSATASDEPAMEALLSRALDFSVAQMIQTALDMAGGFPTVPAPADLMARVAINLSSNIEHGRSALFGLPSRSPGADAR